MFSNWFGGYEPIILPFIVIQFLATDYTENPHARKNPEQSWEVNRKYYPKFD